MKKFVYLILSSLVFVACNNDDGPSKARGPAEVTPQNQLGLQQLSTEDLNRPMFEFNKEQQLTLVVTKDVKLSIYTSPYEPEKMQISLFTSQGSAYTSNYCSMYVESLPTEINTFVKGDQFVFNFADKSMQSSSDSTWATVAINVKPILVQHPEFNQTATIECTKYYSGVNEAKYMSFNEFNSQIEFFGSVLKGN